MGLDWNRLKKGLLLAGVVGLGALGQFYLLWRREYVWDGVFFMAVALACFVSLMRSAAISRPSSQPQQQRQWQIGVRPLVTGLALLLNWIAARSANAQPPPADYTFSTLLWLGSLALLFATYIPFQRLLHTLRNPQYPIPNIQYEFALVLALLLTGLLLRIWDLEHIPFNLSGDEGTQGLWAVDVQEGRLRNPFATGWFTVPTMSFFAQAASLRLFGDSVAGLRTLSALTGTATLLFTYLLARRNFNRRVALFALAALTFNHYHIHFSRLGSNQIADPLFMALTLWLLTEGQHRAKAQPIQGANQPTNQPTIWFLAAGLTMGLSWYGYFGSRVILLVVVAYLGTRALATRGFLRRHARVLALMTLMAFMAASPLLLYYTNYPQNLSARFNQVSFFRWLELARAQPNHGSTLSLVLGQVWRSISAFNHTLDPTYWYHAQMPLLDFISGIFFLLGLATAIGQWRRPGVQLLLGWFVLALTFGWVLTENPPSSMRMVIIAPAMALLVALGLDRLLTLARRTLGGRGAHWNQLGLSLMAVAALLNVHYYFGIYTPKRVFGGPTAETATVLARYLNDRDDRPSVYFYGPPFMYFDFGSVSFIARHVPGVSVPPKDQEPDFQSRVLGPTLFIVLRERLDELAAIQARHPPGLTQEFFSPVDGRLMFVVYEVPR
jgi:hypothetical protein